MPLNKEIKPTKVFFFSSLVKRDFQISFNGWFFTGVITSLQDSSKYSSLFYKCCGLDGLDSSLIWKTVLRTLTTIGVVVTFMIHCFFSSQARFKYLSLISFYFHSAGMAKSTSWQVLFFLLLGLVFWSELDVSFVHQIYREFYVSHFLRRILVCVRTILLAWSNFNLLHNFLPNCAGSCIPFMQVCCIHL